MNNEEIYFAIVTSLVALFGLLFTSLQFKLAKKKRNDDLFNLRFTFYKKVSDLWTNTYNRNNPPMELIDLVIIAEEAEFLFGKDIAEHILSFANKRASNDLFPDDDFSKPFYKYLKLK